MSDIYKIFKSLPDVDEHVRDVPPGLSSPVGFVQEQRGDGAGTVPSRVCGGGLVYAKKYDFYEGEYDHPNGGRVTRVLVFVLPVGDCSGRVFQFRDYPVDVSEEIL